MAGAAFSRGGVRVIFSIRETPVSLVARSSRGPAARGGVSDQRDGERNFPPSKSLPQEQARAVTTHAKRAFREVFTNAAHIKCTKCIFSS